MQWRDSSVCLKMAILYSVSPANGQNHSSRVESNVSCRPPYLTIPDIPLATGAYYRALLKLGRGGRAPTPELRGSGVVRSGAAALRAPPTCDNYTRTFI